MILDVLHDALSDAMPDAFRSALHEASQDAEDRSCNSDSSGDRVSRERFDSKPG